MSDQTPIGFYSGKASATPSLLDGMTLNQPNMDFREGKVRIKAILDLEGLAHLETSIAALRVLLRPKSAEDMRLENARHAPRPDPFAWR